MPVRHAGIPSVPEDASLGYRVNPAKLDPVNDEVATGATAATAGGLDSTYAISAASTNGTVLKASAGRVYTIEAWNSHTSQPRYVKLYDKATVPNPASDSALHKYTKLLWGFSTPSVKSDVLTVFPHGLGFVNGISYMMTGGPGTNDTTAIGANEVIVNITYK
jgi:hypothetical protein